MTEKPKRNPIAESGLQAGFKAGWAAACHTIADEMRRIGATQAATTIEGWAVHAPVPEIFAMNPGESVEDANARHDREKEKLT